MKTQEQWVRDRLIKDSFVTRNTALGRRITRLSAIIWDLKDLGWKIEGKYHKGKIGKAFVYSLVPRPKK